jgi:hypothetical protein
LVQLIAIIVPPAMLLLSLLGFRSPRRAIQASIVAELLVSLAAARILVPELLSMVRCEDPGWAGRLLLAGSIPVVLVSLAIAVFFCHYLAAIRHSHHV